MRTLILQDGSLVKLVDVKAVRVNRHFWHSDQFYIDLDMRNGGTREDIQHVSSDAAHQRRSEIVSLMQEAWGEVDAYQCGREEGGAEAHAAGHAQDLEEGRTQGYGRGWDNGFREGKQQIITHLQGMRENLMWEQTHGDYLPPSRRRYLRNAIDTLNEAIYSFSRGDGEI